MPFTIRIEVNCVDTVDGEILKYAVARAVKRYPYFLIRVAKKGEEYIAEKNGLPVCVLQGDTSPTLGSDEVNGHLIAFSYSGKVINGFASHVICDGAGYFPMMKTVLYYYICERYGIDAAADEIYLEDTPFFEDETVNPWPEDKMKTAKPLYIRPDKPFFRLTEGGYVNDSTPTAYRLKIKESDVLRFSHDNDASPCALISSLMAKVMFSLHPQNQKDIVSAVSFNLRPALRNIHNYRMLCSWIALRYPKRMAQYPIDRLCTCSRGMVSIQSQPENVLYYGQNLKEMLEEFEKLPLSEKKAIMGEKALCDCTENTFSVSYVGRVGIDSLAPYINSIYNFTDGSTYKTLFIEVFALNGWFDVVFLQGFSNSIYFEEFVKELEKNGLEYQKERVSPLNTPKMFLP
ncbi:MAG: hypothetical protein KBS41_03390 [Oscillospiraceae bacterium]|nr:hypothetical protein [Candidatus Equicaccousia limihippi]